MSKKRILFLFNGGTIGQQYKKTQNGEMILFPPKDETDFKKVCEPIIQKFIEKFDIDFELVTTKDSTNMTPNDWEKLIFRIKKAQDSENYDAVGIVHGTDTLPYTAIALSLSLHGKTPKKSGLRIPICITGAQNTIHQTGGDARFNLENLFRTLEEAIKLEVADVITNFWNRILLGCRTLKVSEKNFDAMSSPAYEDVGEIDSSGVYLKTHLLRLKKDADKKLSIAPKFGRGVVGLELTPGIEPSVISGFITGGGISAMILNSLGEGNVCTEAEYNLIPMIKQATEEYMTPIFITTKFVGGNASSSHYEVGIRAIEAGGITCFDHTDVAVDVKVRWLIGNGLCSSIEDFRKAMATNFAGEVTIY